MWPEGVDDACTLPTVERPLRIAEFDELFATAVRDVERLAPGTVRMTLAGPASLEETVRDLAARETACCAFFTFTVTASADAVVLDIAVPPEQTPVLDALTDRAIRSSAPRTNSAAAP
jgi:hypothetical protein